MTADVLLVSAPVMSVLRPSAALGLLQAALAAVGVSAQSLYLNLVFADMIGIDLNERLGEDLPSHLLAGEWLFELDAPAADRAGPSAPGSVDLQRQLDVLEELESRLAELSAS